MPHVVLLQFCNYFCKHFCGFVNLKQINNNNNNNNNNSNNNVSLPLPSAYYFYMSKMYLMQYFFV